jgi:hypothetical protein
LSKFGEPARCVPRLRQQIVDMNNPFLNLRMARFGLITSQASPAQAPCWRARLYQDRPRVSGSEQTME